jgi:hypothetical protein
MLALSAFSAFASLFSHIDVSLIQLTAMHCMGGVGGITL